MGSIPGAIAHTQDEKESALLGSGRIPARGSAMSLPLQVREFLSRSGVHTGALAWPDESPARPPPSREDRSMLQPRVLLAGQWLAQRNAIGWDLPEGA
jgi:hypothetical protein